MSKFKTYPYKKSKQLMDDIDTDDIRDFVQETYDIYVQGLECRKELADLKHQLKICENTVKQYQVGE